MINWRCIKIHGFPTEDKKYLVTDGIDVSTSDASINRDYVTGKSKFIKWIGDDNNVEINECCSGTPFFDLTPTHWCPIDEINLPNKV